MLFTPRAARHSLGLGPLMLDGFIEQRLVAAEVSALHAIADLRPQSGGTSRVVVDLADALGKHASIEPVLVTQALAGEPSIPSLNPRVRRVVGETGSLHSLRLGLPFRKALRKAVVPNHKSLIHNHGLWLPLNHWASSFARDHKLTMLIQPHGMLEPWALKHKGWKKQIAMAIFQRGDLDAAAAFIATSVEEYENIRRVGFQQPIAVVPNGVDIDVAPVMNLKSSGSNKRTVLFMSRIHPKKGLENLIHAWARIAPTDWRLRIAGPDERGYLQRAMGLVKELGMENSVEYVGSIDAAQKSVTFRDADLFVLPTFSENFGVVVAEALAHGVPVITTRGAPWADLETHRCGWWIEIGVAPLERALRVAMSLSAEERAAMGVRGRKYVRRYDWDNIALQTIDVYRWLLRQGPKPGCVITD